MTADKVTSKFRSDSMITTADIERICKERSEQSDAPKAFLLSSSSTRNSLLAVAREFLDDGQGFPWPGLQLANATFDPDWGYASAKVDLKADGTVEFEQPSCRFEDSAFGETWGYRLCPVEHNELPELIAQLAHIRRELAGPQRARTEDSHRITIADL